MKHASEPVARYHTHIYTHAQPYTPPRWCLLNDFQLCVVVQSANEIAGSKRNTNNNYALSFELRAS